MIALLLGVGLLAAAGLGLAWDALAIRDARWHIYALRDELRWLAIEDAEIAARPAFRMLDEELTKLAPILPFFTIWMMSAIILPDLRDSSRRRRQPLDTELARPENAQLKKLHDSALAAVIWMFLRRHLLIWGTIFGLATMFGAADRLQRAGRDAIAVLLSSPAARRTLASA